MGICSSNAVTVPEPDARTLKAMQLMELEQKDLVVFWKLFRKMDKNLSGAIDIAEYYKFLEEKRSIFGDSIFDVIGSTQAGSLEFGEFIHAVGQYCLFEKEEILRFCFYIFDKDKNGYIEQEELHMMVNVMHGLAPNAEVTGNLKRAMDRLDLNEDGKVDFREFQEFHTLFPGLFYPAFRIQVNMRTKICGTSWWLNKRQALQRKKDATKAAAEKEKNKEMHRLVKLQGRKIRRKMGILRYFCCYWDRQNYEAEFPIVTGEEPELTSGKLKAERLKEREMARHKAEMALKNPETAEWKKYKEKKDAAKKAAKAQEVKMLLVGEAGNKQPHVRPEKPAVRMSARQERSAARRVTKRAEARL